MMHFSPKCKRIGTLNMSRMCKLKNLRKSQRRKEINIWTAARRTEIKTGYGEQWSTGGMLRKRSQLRKKLTRLYSRKQKKMQKSWGLLKSWSSMLSFRNKIRSLWELTSSWIPTTKLKFHSMSSLWKQKVKKMWVYHNPLSSLRVLSQMSSLMRSKISKKSRLIQELEQICQTAFMWWTIETITSAWLTMRINGLSSGYSQYVQAVFLVFFRAKMRIPSIEWLKKEKRLQLRNS